MIITFIMRGVEKPGILYSLLVGLIVKIHIHHGAAK